MKRSGWIPDTDVEIPFPESGSVTVNRSIDPRSATSSLKVVTDMGNAVIQLYDPATDSHVISVYVRRGDEVTIPVPPGTYRMHVIEGEKWHGHEQYFDSTTTFETVNREMTFSERRGCGIDLHRSRAENLHARANFSAPQLTKIKKYPMPHPIVTIVLLGPTTTTHYAQKSGRGGTCVNESSQVPVAHRPVMINGKQLTSDG
ncbi:hypothetical protein QUC32_26960 (plasmid) [Novosphingobium resinovorum]|uniref:hypothetical protein n=2 Tax=Novosphingobium TaxID=165696 RepID=UPI0025A1A4BC|nr:hypothetical protein [Novosphingobium resinovorum]MBF7015351.1 hypothetical protein [Novosphingobium sp. HR1a]WJM30028.1 hypothetical protein QUC32_26960 [Novosphingobium resinovorum]